MSNYRLDSRTRNEFKQQIKLAHVKEAEIAVRLCIFEKNKGLSSWPKLRPLGCDFTGEFIEKTKDVSIDPDFSINDVPVEITRSDKPCYKFFHEKVAKVYNCLENNYDLVFVNGTIEEEPYFIRLDSKQLEVFTSKATKKYGEVAHAGTGNKAGYRYDIEWFDGIWQPLPKLITRLPKDYTKILNLQKV